MTIEISGLVVHRSVVSHPLLGAAHVIEHAGRPITAMSAIDWDRPTRIPTVAEPRRLPRGSGSMLVNEIAQRAQRAGVHSLRYAGPYPTPALFQTLLRSFRTSASEADFSADVLARALRLARDELPIDFSPAPFIRRVTTRGFVDRRAEIERVSIDGVLYDRGGTPGSLARLIGASAELGFANVRWVRTAVLDVDGDIADGPHPIPALADKVLGTRFPDELREQFADLVSDAVPSVLATDARAVVRSRSVEWADLGWRAATRTADGFAVHAGYWTHLAPHGLAPFAVAVGDALANVVVTTILDEVAE